MMKDRVASGLGSVLEWYDFSLYGFFAPILAPLYFPSDAPSAALLKMFVVFAVGFIARPIGALIFGYVSDKQGRARCLKLTPLLITLPTLLLSLLPTYQQIGILAPIALIILRILQGICIGGEYANTIVYFCETTEPKKLYFWGSVGSCVTSFGILLASAVAALWYSAFTSDQLHWVWRIAFALSLPIGIMTYWMRRNITETNVFRTTVIPANENPILTSWRFQWRDYLLAIGLTFLPATGFYFTFIFMPNYLSQLLSIDPKQVLSDNAILLFARLMIIPLLGFVADRVGGITLARVASLLFILFSVPIFYGITYQYANFGYLIYLFALFTTLNAASTPGLLIELLKPGTRGTVISFTLNFCFGILGGMAPFIGFLLSEIFDSKIAPIYYLLLSAVVSFISITIFNQRKKRHAREFQLLTNTY